LADYLSRARGVYATPERIVICSGFAQGLTLLCHALRARGATRVATEAYGHPSHRATVVANGLELATVSVDGKGAAVDELAGVNGALLTPAHQFPLGSTLAAGRRVRAVDWARETDSVIIENDYDGEFRYDRRPVGAMQALAPDHVVFAGTASKTLAPGLRLGWLVLPTDLIDPTLAAKQLTAGPSTFDQLTMAEFIASGGYDRHVRRSRLAYRRRRDKLVNALRQHVPRASITGVGAGLHVVVELPPGQHEDDVVACARGHGLMLRGLDAYRIGAQPLAAALVIGYGTPPEHAFSAATETLCAVLAPQGPRPTCV